MSYLYNSVWIFCISFLMIKCQTQTCLNQINNINTYFGEKADYKAKDSKDHFMNGCLQESYWGIFRYDEKEFSTQNYTQLSQKIINNINTENECGYFMPWNISEEEILAKVKKTIISIAESLKRKYTFFRPHTHLDEFSFIDTVSENRESIREFLEVLLSRNIGQNFIITDNNITQNIKNCSAFQSKLEDYSESNKFILKSEFQQMIKEVKEKLECKTNFSVEQLKLVYELCRLETSVLKEHNSLWCSVLNEDHLKLLEYNEDLLSYYSKSYGNEYSKNIGCHIVKEMSTVLLHNNKPHILTFTNSVLFQTFLTALGYRKDSSPLTADNYKTENNYLWRTSQISPIGANFAAVKYDCGGEVEKKNIKVKFFLNEEQIRIFDCPDGVCELEFLQNKLKNITEKCTYQFCTKVKPLPEPSEPSSASSIFHTFLILVITSLLLIF